MHTAIYRTHIGTPSAQLRGRPLAPAAASCLSKPQPPLLEVPLIDVHTLPALRADKKPINKMRASILLLICFAFIATVATKIHLSKVTANHPNSFLVAAAAEEDKNIVDTITDTIKDLPKWAWVAIAVYPVGWTVTTWS